MEKKFINFETAMLAMLTAQYVKAIEGYHVTSSVVSKENRIAMTIFSDNTDVVCLPDGYLYSERIFDSIGFIDDTEWFTTTYYFIF